MSAASYRSKYSCGASYGRCGCSESIELRSEYGNVSGPHLVEAHHEEEGLGARGGVSGQVGQLLHGVVSVGHVPQRHGGKLGGVVGVP